MLIGLNISPQPLFRGLLAEVVIVQNRAYIQPFKW